MSPLYVSGLYDGQRYKYSEFQFCWKIENLNIPHNMAELSEAFWISLVSITSGLLIISIKYCLKSKCDLIECGGGCLKIHRNTEQEIPEQESLPPTPHNQFRV